MVAFLKRFGIAYCVWLIVHAIIGLITQKPIFTLDALILGAVLTIIYVCIWTLATYLMDDE